MARKTVIQGYLLIVALLLACPHQAAAELQARPLSPSVVLVLKLVSHNRVQPTTGIVMSNDGLVMVPSEFVSPGDEVIVLDGGTDIIKNGRPAKLLKRAGAGDWAVLSVDGLTRPGITLSENRLSESSALHLTAFPPAEYIANGLPPLWAEVRVQVAENGDTWSVSEETRLPYVTGPILDECGYLVGVTLTSGIQSIETDRTPVSLFANSLKNTLDDLELELGQASCALLTGRETGEQSSVENESPAAGQQAVGKRDSNLVGPEVYNPLIKRKRLNPFQGAAGTAPPDAPRPFWSRVPWWLTALALLMVSVAGWRAWSHWRPGRQKALRDSGQLVPETPSQATFPGTETIEAPIRSVPGKDDTMPDLDALPPGCDGVLAVQVHSDARTRFSRFRSVDTAQFDLVLGRVNADINIEVAGIGSPHARLKKTGDRMTLSDLGSGSPTLINEIPCLPGEVLYLEAGDDVYLGSSLLRFSVIRKDKATA